MDEIKRPTYLNRLIARKENGMIKVITGIRRCGKSYLLFNLYYDYLIQQGVDQSHIIAIPLDDDEYEALREKARLREYIKAKLTDAGMYYLFLDEIQLVDGFEGLLNGLNRNRNLDIYVTGSNSKFLSSDIITEFRGRGDEVRIYPLSFSEFCSAYEGETNAAWREFSLYGSLPMILSFKSIEQKTNYLKTLFEKVYVTDIVDRNNIRDTVVLEKLLQITASSVGSLTNPLKLANTFQSNGYGRVSDNTVRSYLQCLEDAFMIEKAMQYNVKGKKYISTPFKYYFMDVGLRNAFLNFRQYEETHLMENILYNELLIRGYSVDVGVVEHNTVENGKKVRKRLEVDFVCNQGSERYYLQSAFAIPDAEKLKQEQESLIRISDSFKKFIIVREDTPLWRTEQGVTVMGIKDFLLNQESLKI